MPREHQLLAVSVTKAVDRISAARLVYLDGSAAAGGFPLSDSDTFVPGREVEILAGAGSDPAPLFTGIVVRQSLKVREHAAPQLVVECRHAAAKLTVGRRSAYFLDQSDADVISALLDAAEIPAEVDSTAVVHPQQVQFSSTDWDFLLTRAQASGLLVLTNGETVEVRAPAMDGSPVATLQFGATVLEMDAELESRRQYGAVRSLTWDPAQQALLEKEAADPGFEGPGNLPGADLAAVAGLPFLPLAHPALSEEEAQAWADAKWLRSRMSRASGRVKCQGIGSVNPGDVVTLAGVGERFGGDVFVTGVRHEMDLVQGWKTHVQFGSVDAWLGEEERVSAPPAGGLLPAVRGLQVGVVVSNEDPAGEFRVRVRMPLVSGDAEGAWARVAALDAGPERGAFFRPEVGDEVVLGFLHDDPRQAVILGMLHSSARPAPLEGSDDNHEKLYQSRSKLRLHFDDEKKALTLETPAGNSLVLSEDAQGIRLADQNGNAIEMTPEGIRIESAKALEMKAGTEAKLESGTSLGVKGGAELKMEGASGAELSSSAITKVRGSLVQVN